MPRILVVEDQADIRRLIRWSLDEEPDIELFEAATGQLGLEAVRALRPDLLLLDVMMPGELDGLQVCQRIKSDAAMRGIKVVLLTARGQVRDREAGQAAGADEYLVKPFSPLQLIETLDRLMATA